MTMDHKVHLVPLTTEHMSKTYEWVRDVELRRMFLMRGEQPTWEEHCAYFERLLKDPTQMAFGVMRDEEHIGNCGFKHLRKPGASGELWVYLGEKCNRGIGIGKKAVMQLMAIGVNELGLEKLVVHVADFNTAAQRLYASLGFCVSNDVGDEWSGRDRRVIRMVKEKVAS